MEIVNTMVHDALSVPGPEDARSYIRIRVGNIEWQAIG